MDEPGRRVPIPHLSGNLMLVRDQQRSRERRILPECSIDISGGASTNPREDARGRGTLTEMCCPALWRGRRCGDDRGRREQERERRQVVSPPVHRSGDGYRRDSDSDPRISVETREKSGDIGQICGADEGQLGSIRPVATSL